MLPVHPDHAALARWAGPPARPRVGHHFRCTWSECPGIAGGWGCGHDAPPPHDDPFIPRPVDPSEAMTVGALRRLLERLDPRAVVTLVQHRTDGGTPHASYLTGSAYMSSASRRGGAVLCLNDAALAGVEVHG